MQFIIKLKSFQKNIQADSFQDLDKKIRQDFKYIVSQHFRISYTDLEEDEIIIASQDDFLVALACYQDQVLEATVINFDQLDDQNSEQDQFKNSIHSSVKLLNGLNESLHRRRLNSTAERSMIKSEDTSKQNLIKEMESKIQKYKNSIKELEQQIKDIQPQTLIKSDGFQKFVSDLQQNEKELWESTDQYIFKDRLIDYLSLQDDFKILIKQKSKEMNIQWKKQQAKQKYIQNYQDKINKKQSTILQQGASNEDQVKEITPIYTDQVKEKALLLSQFINQPMNVNLLDYVATNKELCLDDLVWMSVESISKTK